MQLLKIHTSLLLGDLIYALPGIQQVCRAYGWKAVIYLELNVKWEMAEVIMRRGGITLLPEDLDKIKPLLMAQDYIEDVLPYNGEKCSIDLDEIMGTVRAKEINIPYGCLPRWYWMLWPDMACDLSAKWLHLDDRIHLCGSDIMIISRSARSHNPNTDYTVLEKYKDRILFIGHDDEWRSFCNFFPVKHYKVESFLEMALLINSARCFLGNQSFPYAIAEGLKVPRILEIYSPLPHVIPTGDNAYDFYYTAAMEYYVDKLMS